MPKEYVTTRAVVQRTNEQGGRQEAIRVGWERDCWVQIATVLRGGIEGSTDDTTAEVDRGQFVDLDRPSINHLIQVLRRARDQAYGRDE